MIMHLLCTTDWQKVASSSILTLHPRLGLASTLVFTITFVQLQNIYMALLPKIRRSGNE